MARGLSLCMDSLPSLLTLRVGWGFGGAALQTLCGSSTSLIELQTGVGASLSDWGLTELVRVCPHIRSLTLGFANLTDSGGCISLLNHMNCIIRSSNSWFASFRS